MSEDTNQNVSDTAEGGQSLPTNPENGVAASAPAPSAPEGENKPEETQAETPAPEATQTPTE